MHFILSFNLFTVLVSKQCQLGRLFFPVFQKIIYGTNQLPSGMFTKFCHIRMKSKLGTFYIKGHKQEPCLLKTSTKRPFPECPSKVNHICRPTRVSSNMASLVKMFWSGLADYKKVPSMLSCWCTQLLVKPLSWSFGPTASCCAKRKNNLLTLKSKDGVAIVY